ncbi:DUF1189 family protein [Enterococcus nangangensis]
MTLFQGFRFALTDFKKLIQAVLFPFWKVILYALFLAGLLVVPLLVEFGETVANLKADAQTITEQMPEFDIQDGALNTQATEGEIYLTDHLIVTFDPAGKRSTEAVIGDAVGNIIAVGLLPNELVIGLPDNAMAESFFDAGHLEIPYTSADMEGFNTATLKEAVHLRIPLWVYLLLFLLVLYPVLLNFLISVLIITLGAHLYTRLRLLRLLFSATFKIVVFASTLPVLVMVALNLLGINYNQLLLMTILTLLVFARVIRAFRQAMTPPPK